MNKESKINLLKKIIREEIGRNYKSVNDMPMDYTKYPELDVSVDFLSSLGGDKKWMAKVKISGQPDSSASVKYFVSQEDANNWARNTADTFRNKIMNSDNYDAVNIARKPRSGKAII